MAKPDVVVEVVLVADESSVDDGIVDFFFPILSNRAKFLRVNRGRFTRCLLSSPSPSPSPSLPTCRFRNRVAGETGSGISTLSVASGARYPASANCAGWLCGSSVPYDGISKSSHSLAK